MKGYLIRRVAASIVVVIGIALIAFVLLHFIASSPAVAILGDKASPRAIRAFNKSHGYDRPLLVQFINYLNSLVHGNLGYSYKLSQSVNALFAENAPRSIYLSLSSLIIAIIIAVPLGVFQAIKRNSGADYTVTAISFILYSTPVYFIGLILIQVFALNLHIFPGEASQSTSVLGVIEDPRAMLLPVLTLVAIQVARYSRYQRSSSLDSLAQDYIRLARAKGLPERAVLFRHLLRNSILPMITLIGLSVPALFAGNLITETLFNYPGLGLLFYNALQNEDYPILLAYTLVAGVFTVIGNLMADIASTVADPRIRL